MKSKPKNAEPEEKESVAKVSLIVQLIMGYIIILVITLPLNNLLSSLKLSIAYFFFVYSPFLPLIQKTSGTHFLEKFLLINLIGICFNGIYAVLDLVFKIPLTKITYLIVTIAATLFSWYYYLARKR